MVLALNKPRSPLSITRREHKDLLDRLAPKLPSRVRCCAAQLISHFHHCHKWKEANYSTRWYYQPLADIRHDLMDAFSIHVLRQAIALLTRLEFLTVESNDRDTNGRNGQDRTHRYWLHSDRIELALETLYSQPNSQPKPQSPAESPFVNFDICDVNFDIPDFTVETYTQIPYSASGSASLSLKEAREKFEFLTGEEELEVSQSNSTSDEVPKDIKRDCDKKPNLGTDKFSAAPALECVELSQDDMKPLPKLKSESVAQQRFADRSSGFRTEEELDGFYQALLELGKSQGKKSPVAWASAIIKSIHEGNPCQYLIEYREGQRVGICEKQEWEIAPGQPYEQFLTYLKTKNKKTGMTDEEAIAFSHRQLQDVNLARSLWESCKRYIAKCSEDWEKQKQLGVQNAYLPPELLPEQKVSLDQVESAIASLQAGCIQLQGLGLAESVKLEPAKELVIESAVTESEPVTTADADVDELELAKELTSEPAIAEQPMHTVSAAELQQNLNLPMSASLVRLMVKNNPQWGYRIEEGLILPAEGIPSLEHLRSLLDSKITASRVQRLIDRNPEWGLLIDRDDLGMIHPEVETIDNKGIEDNLGMFWMGIPNLSLEEASSLNTGEEGSEPSLEGGYIPEPSLSIPQESCDVEPVDDTDLGNNLGMPIPNHPEVPEVCDTSVQTGTHQCQERNELSERTDKELHSLGWSVTQIRDYLVANYKKKSRKYLSDDELQDFVSYLEAQSSPEVTEATPESNRRAQEVSIEESENLPEFRSGERVQFTNPDNLPSLKHLEGVELEVVQINALVAECRLPNGIHETFAPHTLRKIANSST